GENRSETVYVEHKCLFEVDINKVYISPSLNYEHKRIARLVQQGEVITNMFAGAGLFSIIIAKYARPRKVYSIDINPFAYQYMVKNIALNKVEDIVEPILGDAKEVVETRLSNSSNRVLMPYPELALEYLPYAVKALLNRKGWIHVYLHVKTNRGEHYIDKSIELIDKRLREIGVYEYRVNLVRKVRNVGPRTHQMVIDIELK
ncbi:MAG: class I SAM-dependent methyltransferase family protein, partial [Desulfurococcaceae archaeon]